MSWTSNEKRGLEHRLDFIKLDAAARQRIAALAPLLNETLPGALDNFYAQVTRTPETAKFFSSPADVARAKETQLRHWKAVGSGVFDDNYVATVRRIGLRHAQIGIEPQWYIGGYALLLEAMVEAVLRERWPKGVLNRNRGEASKETAASIAALIKAVMLDVDMSLAAYFEAAETARLDAEARAQATERALVTATIGAGLAQLAENDLTCRVADELPDAYARLREDFNRSVERLGETLAGFASATNSIHASADEIAIAARDLAQRTEQQAANAEETAAVVQEITSSAKKTAEAATEGRRLVRESKQNAERAAMSSARPPTPCAGSKPRRKTSVRSSPPSTRLLSRPICWR